MAAVDSAVDEIRILHTGFLVKQGKIVKNWKNRWFVLYSDGKLRYYKKHPGGDGVPVIGTHAGSIDTVNCTAIQQAHELGGFDWPCSDTRSCFTLVLPHRTYYLICGHADEAKDWQKLIAQFMSLGRAGSISSRSDADRAPSVIVESDENDSDSDAAEEDAMSMLSQALSASESTSFSRSQSVLRGRLDTHSESMLKEESEIMKEREKQGAK